MCVPCVRPAPSPRRHHARLPQGLYGTVPYMLTKMLTRLTLGAIMMVIITAISYFMGGFEVEHYAFFLLTVAASFAALDGTLAFISVMSPTHEVANALAGTFLTLCSLFNGFTSNSRSSPDWIIWIQYVSVAYYSFVAVAGELFETYTRYPWDCRLCMCSWRCRCPCSHPSFCLPSASIPSLCPPPPPPVPAQSWGGSAACPCNMQATSPGQHLPP